MAIPLQAGGVDFYFFGDSYCILVYSLFNVILLYISISFFILSFVGRQKKVCKEKRLFSLL